MRTTETEKRTETTIKQATKIPIVRIRPNPSFLSESLAALWWSESDTAFLLSLFMATKTKPSSGSDRDRPVQPESGFGSKTKSSVSLSLSLTPVWDCEDFSEAFVVKLLVAKMVVKWRRDYMLRPRAV